MSPDTCPPVDGLAGHTSPTLPVMVRDRIARTFDRLRAGELPAPTAVRTLPATARRATCSGCGDVIEHLERYYYARAGGSAVLRFHLICHEAWIRFRCSA